MFPINSTPFIWVVVIEIPTISLPSTLETYALAPLPSVPLLSNKIWSPTA